MTETSRKGFREDEEKEGRQKGVFPLTPDRALRILKPSIGAVAQLGERLNGIQEVSGSIPLSSISATP